MDNIHDLGGMEGFGPVVPEFDEPTFHAEWEGRMLGLQRSILFLGLWNLDIFRYAQEKIHPTDYLKWSYYERWAHTMIATALEKGLVTPDELKGGAGDNSHLVNVNRAFTSKHVRAAFVRGNFERNSDSEPLYSIGDVVMTRNIQIPGHTRLPRYAREKLGTVIAVRGRHVFPDAVVNEGVEDPQWLYTIEFQGAELWGDSVDPTIFNLIDAFEPYLERP